MDQDQQAAIRGFDADRLPEKSTDVYIPTGVADIRISGGTVTFFLNAIGLFKNALTFSENVMVFENSSCIFVMYVFFVYICGK